ncbi:hypothetical protein OG519_32120 [Streptomyces sp. NBC_01190]|nr:hypothetical protein OG519_32120 [Streptomyces sp. NBC_01190]
MRAQPGFLDCYLLRATSDTRFFSHVGWWAGTDVYGAILETGEYKEQMTGLLALADIVDVEVYVPAGDGGPREGAPA